MKDNPPMKSIGIRSLSIALGITILLAGFTVKAEDKYDTLDGTGESGKTVNVIEWEGNLEIHVYPKGSLKGLALKLDRKNKDKPVMVIGYRFDYSPKKQIIRRAILGIPLKENFYSYRDLSADDYDKVIISNNVFSASKELVAYNTDPEPTQLYPDGHPANDEKQSEPKRAVASVPEKPKADSKSESKSDAESFESKAKILDDEGSIRPFKW